MSEPYAATVGNMAALMHGAPNAAPGDPSKVAHVVMELANTEEPPVRLLLGSDAVSYAEAAARSRAAADEQWHSLSLSTDAD